MSQRNCVGASERTWRCRILVSGGRTQAVRIFPSSYGLLTTNERCSLPGPPERTHLLTVETAYMISAYMKEVLRDTLHESAVTGSVLHRDSFSNERTKHVRPMPSPSRDHVGDTQRSPGTLPDATIAHRNHQPATRPIQLRSRPQGRYSEVTGWVGRVQAAAEKTGV